MAMDEDYYEERHQQVQNFAAEFKALVRKYVPTYPPEDMEFLHMLQDQTSCFSPYVWSDD